MIDEIKIIESKKINIELEEIRKNQNEIQYI